MSDATNDEAAEAEAPADLVLKAFAADTEPVEGSRDVIATITTDALDRDAEVVVPAGLDLDNYRKNPVVLWSHNPGALPVGKCLWIKAAPGGRGLVARVRFGTHAAAEDVMKCYKDGLLSAFSIGFRPVEGGKPTKGEVDARPELSGCRYVHRKAEMMEFSAVGIPANPEALVIAKGLKSDEIREAIEKAAAEATPEPKPRPDDEAWRPVMATKFGLATDALVGKTADEIAKFILGLSPEQIMSAYKAAMTESSGPGGGYAAEPEDAESLGYCPKCMAKAEADGDGMKCDNGHTFARSEALSEPAPPRKAVELPPPPRVPRCRTRAEAEKARAEAAARAVRRVLDEAEDRRWGAI